MTFQIKRDGEDITTSPTFEQAVTAIQTLLKLHSAELPATFSIENEGGDLCASVTNRRITGKFTKQVWGGRKGNDACEVGGEEFDATDFVLLMSHDDLLTLQDRRETTDWVGSAHVDWDGPFEVSVTGSICSYFGVERIEEITSEALAFARKAAKVTPSREERITLSFNLSVFVAQGGNVDDFVRDMTLNLKSNTPGVKAGLVGQPTIVKAG